ncbi:hypothetical protein KSP40_PGU012820 [Platanthera guangdongensis]|uniref:Uncharacterized protein n=1 Tax=Platanthera guangdongensis TaxID=2320717 RepID=A0ABR2M505_9ASPA
MAALSILSSSLTYLPMFNPNASSKSKPSLSFARHSSKQLTSLCSRPPSYKVLAAPEFAVSPETLIGSDVPADMEVEGSEPSPLAVGSDSDKIAGIESGRGPGDAGSEESELDGGFWDWQW